MRSIRSRGLAFPGRVPGGKRQFAPRCELLEPRQLLTGVVETGIATDEPASIINDPAPSSLDTAAIVAAPLTDAVDGAPILYRHGVAIASYTPATDTDLDRGVALRDALADAQFGDQIVLDAATYDMGGDEHVEFPAGVTVSGAGKTATKITSSVPIQTDPNATFTLNNQSTVEDLWLEGSLHNGYYQTLVGMAGLPTENVTTYLRRVKITGDSDGIFIWTGTQYQYTLQAFDCDINTNYDAVALLGSSSKLQTVQMWNCNITAAQPSAIPDHNSNAVNVSAGLAQLYNCTLTAIGDDDPSSRSNGVLARTVGQVELRNCTVSASAPAGAVYDLEIQDDATVYVTGGQGSGPGGTYVSSTGTEVYQNNVPTNVLSRGLFYNNSAFDNYNPLAGASDDAAMATDKTALRPGDGTSTFANVSSYLKGINGLTIDLAGYHGDITADDFVFKIGNNNSPADWATAPAPQSVELFGGAGMFDFDRVRIVWPDGAINNTWLQVTLLANADSGLTQDDVFYFGSAPGDSGAGDTGAFVVNSTDEISARNDPHSVLSNPASITNVNDFNRDGNVNATDQIAVRNNATSAFTNALQFLNVDAGGSFAPTVSSETTSAVSPAGPESTLSDPLSSGLEPIAKPFAGIVALGPGIAGPTDSSDESTNRPDMPALTQLETSSARQQSRARALATTLDWLDDCLELP